MPPDDLPDRASEGRFAVVSFPAGRSGNPRTFTFNGWGFSFAIASFILVVVALTIAVLVYTPVGSSLPIADQELERQYGRQIAGIQGQLQQLAQEMNSLTVYNLRLRKILGERISGKDSVLEATAVEPPDSGLHAVEGAGKALVDSRKAGGNLTAGEAAGVPGPQISRRDEQGHAETALQLPLTMPAEGYFSKSFEPGEFHYGMDIAGKEGSGIFAAADGHVVFSGWTYDDGYTLLIAHAEGFVTVYKHNQSLLKITGATVKRGDLVALMGNTGRTSSGPHLHFEVWKNGIADNPQQYFLTTP
ncbi:MAG TPA: M23 family metallopeptidase [Bacteroidota bacterium]|jgi:murein DD-endopeptidase MepM/ murein hydrolase activator NlpD